MQQPIDSTREKRNSVIVRAMVRAPGGTAVERRVRNLSRSGACVEHAGDLRDGMTVVLQIGTIQDLRGQVMWITDRLAGLSFAEAIDLEEARKPRGVGVRPQAGWIAEINDAYRR
ncbi:PilZ domain-containing protein [Sphingomonas sp. A2-49]|uniref:PilZ domain-containing protein n=1 Tax=Sphingomonas sp. A2-49 TaxID=1391375 RepID=UPI0021D06962|nr:PilZ domain-containing protein [Sphingomonas sp. A2-49]MCU6455016.1 PilZ domain-containing protein [Sphingomonas sp. A2-49]